MTDKKISELTEATVPEQADMFPAYDSGAAATRKISILSLFGNVYFPNHAAADQGDTGNSDTVKYAIDTANTDLATIVLRNNSGTGTTTYTFVTSDTLGSNIVLEIEKGALIAGPMVIYSPANIKAAPNQQIFTGAGPATFTTGGDAYVEWWATNTTPGTTDVSTAFESAANSGASKIIILGNQYMDGVTLSKNITVSGGKITVGGVFAINNVNGVTISGIEFDGDSFGNTTNLINITGTSKNIEIKNCYLHHSLKDGINLASTTSLINIHDNRIEDIGDTGIAVNAEGMGIYVNGASEVRIHNNYLTKTRGHGAVFIYQGNSIQVTSNRIENTSYRGIEVYGSTPYSTDIDIIGNNITETGGYLAAAVGSGIGCNGIYVASDTPGEIRIINNFIKNVVENGIEGTAIITGNVIDTTGYRYADLPTTSTEGIWPGASQIVTNNVIKNAYREGIRGYFAYSTSNRIFKNNIIIDPSRGIAASGILIQVNGAFTITNSDISNNVIINTGGSTTYGLGITTSGGATSDGTVTVNNNVIRGTYATAPMYVVSYVTEMFNNSFQAAETLTAATPALSSYDTDVSLIDSTSNAVNGTLASGRRIGQIKTIVMTNATNSSTVTVANHETSDPEVFTFAAVDATLVLMWTGTEWITIANSGVTT